VSTEKATLVIDDDGYKFRIQWQMDDDLGGYLGQDVTDGVGEANPKWDRDEWEHWAASRAVKDFPGVQRDSFGFYWETNKEVRAALTLARAALKHDRPMPEWAKTALAAGWKAPKGWKP